MMINENKEEIEKAMNAMEHILLNMLPKRDVEIQGIH